MRGRRCPLLIPVEGIPSRMACRCNQKSERVFLQSSRSYRMYSVFYIFILTFYFLLLIRHEIVKTQLSYAHQNKYDMNEWTLTPIFIARPFSLLSLIFEHKINHLSQRVEIQFHYESTCICYTTTPQCLGKKCPITTLLDDNKFPSHTPKNRIVLVGCIVLCSVALNTQYSHHCSFGWLRRQPKKCMCTPT